jgi:3-deoxy-manno-octulosonate cytidylyltransferase (CMP-KDO synthetase)
MQKVAIIPARFASTRFPGKPLALIQGKPMIEHVYKRVSEADIDSVVVATDHPHIEATVKAFGGEVVMTSPNHPSGTDRCGEVAEKLQLDSDALVVNVQGDEPLIRKEEINLLVNQFQNTSTQIATLATPICDKEAIQDPNKVKVVFSKNGRALYFSRYAIPFQRNNNQEYTYCKHIGIYAFRYDILQKIIALTPSALEKSEQLEQLRWLENDFSIQIALCNYESIAIDTPEDLELLLRNPFFTSVL